MIPFIDLRAEYHSIQAEIDDAIRTVFDRGQFILGENVQLFEQEFAAFCGASFGVGVASGTEALQLSLIACDVKTGDEVITVANTAAPTALAITAIGARPVFVDIDPETSTINPSLIERAITNRTRAIIPVHLYGCVANMDPILRVARQAKIHVIEDACQAHGAEFKGRKVGTIGDLGCFSFYPTKNLGAYGDGGIIVTNDQRLYEKIEMLRNLGQSEKYHHQVLGFNSRLDEIQAAILRVKLRHLNEWNKKRTDLAALYSELLQRLPLKLPPNPDYCSRVYHLYVIHVKERDRLQQYLRNAEVDTQIHYPIPMHLQQAFQYLGMSEGSLPFTEKSAHQVLSLPLYPHFSPELIERVVSHISNFMTKETSV
ncbi:DegT/DnrJ/EryC1/StrS family aminotransferase [bacterium]|nr:DegT/DnrJ/EryC1/StrS family aminotransferase [bacterium]